MPDIFLRQGDATPQNVILRDPTQPDSGSIVYLTGIAAGISAVSTSGLFVGSANYSAYILLGPDNFGLQPHFAIQGPQSRPAFSAETPPIILSVPSEYRLLGPGEIPGGKPKYAKQGPSSAPAMVADTAITTSVISLSGTAAGTSTVSASVLDVLFKLTGSVSDTSAVTASAVYVLCKLTGSAADTSAATASGILVLCNLTGAIADSSAASSTAMRVLCPLSGSAADASSASGALTVTGGIYYLTGEADGVSNASGVLSGQFPLSGEADGVSSTSAVLTVGQGIFIPPYAQGRDVYKAPRRRRYTPKPKSAPIPEHVSLWGVASASSGTSAIMRVRIASEGIAAAHSGAHAILSMRIDRGQRKRDEEALIFLEAA